MLSLLFIEKAIPVCLQSTRVIHLNVFDFQIRAFH